jgi:hypothetical protein
MKESKKTGGAAFPESCNSSIISGMTLRDYFAGQALAGLVGKGGITLTYDIIPEMSYNIADAMLKELDK